MGIGFLLIAAVVTLAAAWFVNSLVGLLSGDNPGSLLSEWWSIFSRMGRSPISYAERTPGLFGSRKFAVGDKVRMQLLPLDVERGLPDDRKELLRKCAGKVLRVEGIDQFGGLELHVLDDGTQSPDNYHHIIFVEPQYVELVNEMV